MTTDAAAMAPGPARAPRRFRLTLRRRIVGSIAVLSAIGLLTAGLAALLFERERIQESVFVSLQQEIGEFRELADNGVDPETGLDFAEPDRLITVAMQRNIPDANEISMGYVPGGTIVPPDTAGAVHGEEAFRVEVTRHVTTAYGTYSSPAHPDVLYAVLPIELNGALSHYVIAHDMRAEYSELDGTIRVYAVAAFVAWLGLILAAWMLARRILAPIDELSTTADLISETDLNRRLTVTGGDEMAGMSATFNRMLDRLQAALGAQRRMLDDAGHELRTPITIVRGHLELMNGDDPADVESTRALAIDELDRMNLLVQDLMLLAKAERPDFLTREPVELHLLVEEARDKASGLGERQWLLDPCEPITIEADPRRLTQALLQLASNAYRVTAPGDVIAFGCASSAQGVQLWVRDTGPGVPIADRERIWNRFQSGTGVSAGGTGLGLAIVRAIAEAHDGTASVTTATPAGGAKFMMELPARARVGSGTPGILTEVITVERSSQDGDLPAPDPANDTQLRDRAHPRTEDLPLMERLLGPRKE
ncbi:HAMP domain-containing protein [Nostocoides sp. F2B08]|uniref:sensor histidine kinase n=1 Tax=Nostocoides sp. F2B08 TaxID=2653936 RepID=UPI0012631238|nr:HAMP domain-containing sensor histidine kinase [Tetrasphaera sp. F2B08]KAB7746537.1 HAMP domain-containing protein [Tetrasphaera sp. F2B08]